MDCDTCPANDVERKTNDKYMRVGEKHEPCPIVCTQIDRVDYWITHIKLRCSKLSTDLLTLPTGENTVLCSSLRADSTLGEFVLVESRNGRGSHGG
jgi:hypothetical protein